MLIDIATHQYCFGLDQAATAADAEAVASVLQASKTCGDPRPRCVSCAATKTRILGIIDDLDDMRQTLAYSSRRH